MTADNPTAAPRNTAAVAHPTIGASERIADGIALVARESARRASYWARMRVVLTPLVEWLMLLPRWYGDFLKPHRYSCATVGRKVFCSPIINFKIGDLRFCVGTGPKLGALLITPFTPMSKSPTTGCPVPVPRFPLELPWHRTTGSRVPQTRPSSRICPLPRALLLGPSLILPDCGLRALAQHPVPAIFAHDPAFKLDPSNRLIFPVNRTGL